MIMLMVFLNSVKLKSVLKMILDSKKWKWMKQLFNRGKTKTSLGFIASVNTEFSSKKNGVSLPLEWKRIFQSNFQGNLMKRILKTHLFLRNSTLQVAKLMKFSLRKYFFSYYLLHILRSKAVAEK